MDPTRNPKISTTPSDNSSGMPHVSSVASVITFASVIAIFMVFGLYCTFTRRRSVSAARLRLMPQIHSTMSNRRSTRLVHPANVSLPIRKYTKEEMGGDGRGIEDCPVCLVEFEEGEEVKVVVPGCEHVFHPTCIDRWLAMSNTCPVCRSAVVGDEAYWDEEWIDVEMTVMTEERERGEREVVVVDVENVGSSGEMDGSEGEGGEWSVRMDVESEGAEGREGELEVETSAVGMIDGHDTTEGERK